jgi:hypothetical protein
MISILLPTRNRVVALEKSLLSLLTTASDPTNIEVLLAIDSDDSSSAEYLASTQWHNIVAKYSFNPVVVTSERKGYLNLNQYVNLLGDKARGEWLMFWNDDAEMLTPGWDTHIQYKTYFGCLRMPCENQPHPFALFPIIPKRWVDVFGCISPVTHSDWWVYNVCIALNRVKDIPVSVRHNRADLNGENADETYGEQSYSLDGQSPHDTRDWSHPQRQIDLNNWRETLLLYGYPHETK